MAVGFRGSGKRIRSMDMGRCTIMTGICMKGSGGMTRIMGMGSIRRLMDVCIKDNGRMGRSRARGMRFGRMGKNTLGSLSMDLSMEGAV
jgi:hypothetical protein